MPLKYSSNSSSMLFIICSPILFIRPSPFSFLSAPGTESGKIGPHSESILHLPDRLALRARHINLSLPVLTRYATLFVRGYRGAGRAAPRKSFSPGVIMDHLPSLTAHRALDLDLSIWVECALHSLLSSAASAYAPISDKTRLHRPINRHLTLPVAYGTDDRSLLANPCLSGRNRKTWRNSLTFERRRAVCALFKSVAPLARVGAM